MDADNQDALEELLLGEFEGDISAYVGRFLDSDETLLSGNALVLEKDAASECIRFGFDWDFPQGEVERDCLRRLCAELDAEWRGTSKFRRDGIARRRRLKRGALR